MQFIDRFRELPANVQRLIIGVLFLAVLVGVVILKNMIEANLGSEPTEEDETLNSLRGEI